MMRMMVCPCHALPSGLVLLASLTLPCGVWFGTNNMSHSSSQEKPIFPQTFPSLFFPQFTKEECPSNLGFLGIFTTVEFRERINRFVLKTYLHFVYNGI
jgi:hypothetical protein